MADMIEIGLELSGDDARDFIEYMKNPTYTKDACDCMKAAIRKVNAKRAANNK